LRLNARFPTPTVEAYLPDDAPQFSNLRPPYFRWGVTISPFDMASDETRKGRIVAAFPVYVRDTTPPNLCLGLRSGDGSDTAELKLLEAPGNGTWDVSPLDPPRQPLLYVKGSGFTPDGSAFEDGPREATLPSPEDGSSRCFDIGNEAAEGTDGFYTKENVRLTVTQCAARDNYSFGSISGYEDSRNASHAEFLQWTDYLADPARSPRAVDFPPVGEIRDTPDIPRPCLPRLSYEQLRTAIRDGGAPGLCWYVERDDEYVPGSDCFDRWVVRAATVDENQPGYPFLPGAATHIRVVARDHAGNETNVRIPLKVFGVDIDVRSLKLDSKKGW